MRAHIYSLIRILVVCLATILVTENLRAWQTPAPQDDSPPEPIFLDQIDSPSDEPDEDSSVVDESSAGEEPTLDLQPTVIPQDDEPSPVSQADEPGVLPIGSAAASKPKPQEAENRDTPIIEQPAADKDLLAGSQSVVFRKIEPGRTTLAELKQQWGKPAEQQRETNESLLTYQIEPFKQVQVSIQDDRVSSIVIHLKRPGSPDSIARQLNVSQLPHVSVVDDLGDEMGWTYPERGLTFGFSPQGQKQLVSHILLERITAEPFVLRAANRPGHEVERRLRDLKIALTLDPKDARAWWQRAELQAQLGDVASASEDIENAVRLQPASQQYRLTKARLLADAGQYEQAIRDTKSVLAHSATQPHVKARAACQLGDLMAAAPAHQYNESIKYHQQAVKLAVPPVKDPRPVVRWAAKRVLIDAHLAIAHDVAKGKWKKKEEVVPQWLDRAGKFVDELIQHDEGDQWLQLLISRHRLETYTYLKGKIDPTAAVAEAETFAHRLLAAEGDPTYRRAIRRQLAEVYVNALEIARQRGQVAKALAHAEKANELLETLQNDADSHPLTKQLQGRLYFLTGSIHSVQQGDHTSGVQWFDKALPLLSHADPDRDPQWTGTRGEWLVSMGVSYWTTGNRNRGVELTKQGLTLMKWSVEQNALEEEALVVPYNNLSFMHKQLGNAQQATSFARLAAQVRPQQR